MLGVQGMNRGASIGGHSGWLDGLAQFGFLRYPLFIVFLCKAFSYLIRVSHQQKILYITIIALVFLGMINPVIFPQLWVVVYIFVPFLDSICIYGEEV